MALRTGGMASGLDTNLIIKQLVSIEGMPINKLKRSKSGYRTQISKIGAIKSNLLALKTQLETIDTKKEFLIAVGTSSDDTFFEATATGNAAISSYDITVTQLAKAEKNKSVSFASSTAEVKAGTLTFTVDGGDDQVVTIDEGMTLQDLAAQIGANVTGVSASVVVGKTDTRILLNAETAGYTVGGTASNAITIAESYSGSSGTEVGFTESATAVNAQMTIDGILVESQSNDVTDALTGVSFKLKKVTTQTETLTVAQDNDKIVENIQAFVDKYNSAMALLNKETKISAGTDRKTSLGGDQAVRGLSSLLKRTVTEQISSLNSNKYFSLGSIGITNKSGVMSLDTDKLKKALDDQPQQVASIFTVSDSIENKLNTIVDSYALSDGILTGRAEGLNISIRNIDKRIFRLQDRLEKYERQLVRQFSALEQSVAKLTSQGNFLAGSLGY